MSHSIQLQAGIALIDCRSQAEFEHCHVKEACHIPAADLFKRMHELPKRSEPLQIYGFEEEIKQALVFLESKGYQVTSSWVWDESLVRENAIPVEGGLASKRLWQPAKCIEHFQQVYGYKLTAENRKPTGLDIGCGSGRDMVYLSSHGWQMSGIDFHSDALERAQNLAQFNQQSITTHALDFESTENALLTLEQEFDLVCVVRYLHRPLLDQIKTIIKPGGYILYQTFMQGCEKISNPRNPRFLLEAGELARQFQDFRIYLDGIDHLEDGRPVSRFIAQKK